MEILGWIGWALVKIVGFVWAIVWFLLGGWVATLLQIVILVGVIFGLKYGWRRAPGEMIGRGKGFGRFVWAWARARDGQSEPADRTGPVDASTGLGRGYIRPRQIGDVNVSTLLTLAALFGLLLAVAT